MVGGQKIKVTLQSQPVNYLKLKALLATKRCSKRTLCDMKGSAFCRLTGMFCWFLFERGEEIKTLWGVLLACSQNPFSTRPGWESLSCGVGPALGSQPERWLRGAVKPALPAGTAAEASRPDPGSPPFSLRLWPVKQ